MGPQSIKRVMRTFQLGVLAICFAPIGCVPGLIGMAIGLKTLKSDVRLPDALARQLRIGLTLCVAGTILSVLFILATAGVFGDVFKGGGYG